MRKIKKIKKSLIKKLNIIKLKVVVICYNKKYKRQIKVSVYKRKRDQLYLGVGLIENGKAVGLSVARNNFQGNSIPCTKDIVSLTKNIVSLIKDPGLRGPNEIDYLEY